MEFELISSKAYESTAKELFELYPSLKRFKNKELRNFIDDNGKITNYMIVEINSVDDIKRLSEAVKGNDLIFEFNNDYTNEPHAIRVYDNYIE